MASNIRRANSTPLMRGLLSLTARYGDVTIPLPELGRPYATPTGVLPWLAWGQGVDRWNAEWSEDRKRQTVANAIPDLKRRGSRGGMNALLAEYLTDYGARLTLDVPQPFFFTVTLSVNDADAANVTASLANSLVADLERMKGARDLFQFRQTATATVSLPITVAARALTMTRSLAPIAQPDPADLLNLTTEYGEPLEGGEGLVLEYA